MPASSLLPQIVTAPISSGVHANAPCHFPQGARSPEGLREESLRNHYSALFAACGPQRWWPGRTRFEIIVGAILTQNTSWKNVERAILNLRRSRLLSPLAMQTAPPSMLANAIRPSGYYRQKTRTLKTFVAFLHTEHGGSLRRLFKTPPEVLRPQLLSLRGIGPETADSILLYAGKHPVFVVDSYARRIFGRHGLIGPNSPYEEIRRQFESALPADHQLLNEFHALIVHTGKHFCRKTDPACPVCPLRSFLPSVTLFPSNARP